MNRKQILERAVLKVNQALEEVRQFDLSGHSKETVDEIRMRREHWVGVQQDLETQIKLLRPTELNVWDEWQIGGSSIEFQVEMEELGEILRTVTIECGRQTERLKILRQEKPEGVHAAADNPPQQPDQAREKQDNDPVREVREALQDEDGHPTISFPAAQTALKVGGRRVTDLIDEGILTKTGRKITTKSLKAYLKINA